jgi:3-dehydroquinate synthetase
MNRAGVIVCGSYDIVVGANFLEDVPADILKKVPASKYVVITDANVDRVHGQALRDAFEEILPRDQEVR